MDRLLFGLRGALTLIVMSACSLVALAAAVVTLFQLRRFYSERIVRPCARLILWIWDIRVVLHQDRPFPPTQTIYISNHTSTVDFFVLITLPMPNCRFFLSGFLRKVLPIGLIGYLIGIFWTVPQSFPERRTAIFERAARILRRTGESVYLSPEGERITTGAVGHFNKGAFHLATDLALPIVPIFIDVPRASDPGKGLGLKRGTVHVRVEETIDTRGWRLADLVANKERVRERFVAWNAEYRT